MLESWQLVLLQIKFRHDTIAAVVLTLNEESNLKSCLASLQWCEQVVVLDSGSEDSTKLEALRLGAKFFVHKQASPFEIDKQRNWALDNCGIEHEWILFLDADETVSEMLRDEILRCCNPEHSADYNVLMS